MLEVGVDYAGPFYIKYGSVRKPTIVKGYVCIYVSLSVKAVHLELVSDLSLYCLFEAVCCSSWQALPSLERPRYQLCWRQSRAEGVS